MMSDESETTRKNGRNLALELPTPVDRIDSLSTEKTTLFVKRDDLTHKTYGGNKARKLAEILKGVPREKTIVTVGAAGSNHVLATVIFGKHFGHVVEGVLFPQVKTDHVVSNIRAGLSQGLVIRKTSSLLTAGFRLLWALLSGKFVITVGGSNVVGASAYADAVHELAKQVEEGVLPRPDAIVVTLGSGGTMAGIAVGIEELGWETDLVGVVVTDPPWAAGPFMRRLASSVARFRKVRFTGKRVRVERGYRGAGYGIATEAGDAVMKKAHAAGLHLDATYTAKTFAATLDLVASGQYENVLYWHTLSSASKAPFLEHAPELSAEWKGLLK